MLTFFLQPPFTQVKHSFVTHLYTCTHQPRKANRSRIEAHGATLYVEGPAHLWESRRVHQHLLTFTTKAPSLLHNSLRREQRLVVASGKHERLLAKTMGRPNPRPSRLHLDLRRLYRTRVSRQPKLQNKSKTFARTLKLLVMIPILLHSRHFLWTRNFRL